MSEDQIKDEMEVENDDGEVNEVCVCVCVSHCVSVHVTFYDIVISIYVYYIKL